MVGITSPHHFYKLHHAFGLWEHLEHSIAIVNWPGAWSLSPTRKLSLSGFCKLLHQPVVLGGKDLSSMAPSPRHNSIVTKTNDLGHLTWVFKHTWFHTLLNMLLENVLAGCCSWFPCNLSFRHILFHETTHFLILVGSAFYQIWLGQLCNSWVVS